MLPVAQLDGKLARLDCAFVYSAASVSVTEAQSAALCAENSNPVGIT